MKSRIILADDHAVVRQGLRAFLERSGYEVVAEADNGERAYLAWMEHQPDLMLLDLDMPGVSGLEVLHRILARDERACLLVFSMYDDTIHATRAMQAGARGYVVKTESPEMLLDAVRQVLKGGRFIGHAVAQQMAVERLSGAENLLEHLSPREFEVFSRLAEGMALTEIAEKLHIGYKSAANIQTQVRQKLNVQTTGQMVHLAIRHGVVQSVQKR